MTKCSEPSCVNEGIVKVNMKGANALMLKMLFGSNGCILCKDHLDLLEKRIPIVAKRNIEFDDIPQVYTEPKEIEEEELREDE